ncbi:MAG TPA: RidA family protein [Dehalococcoidia bacterium]|nr:RidA family protein [Dehalococcoidia bacterium]
MTAARPEAAGVHYLNPAGLPGNPAFSQAVAVTGPARTIYIGMQNAVDAAGTIVGKGDVAAQTEQVLKNIEICLAAAGARPEHLVMWTIYVAQGQPVPPAFAVFQRWWGGRPNPPANTVLLTPALIVPDFLIGIEAIAVVPQSG